MSTNVTLHREVIRRDGLPESVVYHDDGCSYHPACLTCPFPACRFDMGPHQARVLARQREVERLRGDGLTVAEMAVRLGVTVRTVQRWEHSGRKA